MTLQKLLRIAALHPKNNDRSRLRYILESRDNPARIKKRATILLHALEPEASIIKIAKETTKGVNWGAGIWHKIRLERKGSDGTIKVFFDDMTKPIMTAEDTNFKSGYVGLGSFDDTGMIDDIKIWGPSVESKKTEFYQRAHPE